jgi:hypothetical protein
MTTSGITAFSVTRDQIIQASLRAIRVIAAGETPTTSMVSDANQALNMMIKAWQGKGIALWLNRIFGITLIEGRADYTLGPGATAPTTRPLEIIEVRLIDTDLNESPISLVSRQEYFNLTNKTTSGKPSMAYYDPQLVDGVLFVWPTPDDDTDVIEGTAKYPIEIFNALNDTPDFPEEWFEAIKFNLAKRLIPEYDVPTDKAAYILQMAQESFDIANDFDREHTSVRFAYDRTR